jgi:preprotein translocase subunit Sec61beta
MEGKLSADTARRPGSEPRPRKAGLAQTAQAVLWSFFGVRKRSDYERDAANLNPVYVIVTGLAAAALFVVVLLVVVHWATR